MFRDTLELRAFKDHTNVFNFDYDFYDNQFRADFQQKFFDTYYFNEIGFEAADRFRHRLKAKLNLIMPYYTQLYQTELAAEGLDFLLNKDLKEEFLREVDTENKENGSSENVEKSNFSNHQIVKSSNIDDGLADLSEDNLTGITGSNGENNASSNLKNNTSKIANEKQIEKTTFRSKGNIGVTSSAELLEKWRKVLINIDKLIIDECSTLFMLVY